MRAPETPQARLQATASPTVVLDGPPPGPPPHRRRGWVPGALTPREVRLLRTLALVAVAGGAVARAVLVGSSWGVMESDEAVVGLMARAILDGQFPTFFWGQPFGGTAEAILTAAVFAVTGASAVAVRAVPLVLSAGATVLLWRVGRRTAGPVVGAAAALAFWLWPMPFVAWSIKSRGFYWATIVAGLTFVLCALRLGESPSRRRDAVIAGLAAGIGWWSAPQIVVFVIPAVYWVVTRARPALPPLLKFGLPAAVLGAAPWLVYNLGHGFASLRVPGAQAEGNGSYLEHLAIFATKGLPTALGLRLPFEGPWVPAGVLVYLAVVVTVVVLLFRRRPILLPAALVVFPLVHALSPWSGYVGEARYLVYLGPFLALTLATLVGPRLTLVGLVGVLAALTLYGFVQTGPAPMPYANDRLVPADFGPLVDGLERWGVTGAYADYWIAYRVAFESGGRVAVGVLPQEFARSADHERRARTAPRVAYVAVTGSASVDDFKWALDVTDGGWEEHEVGGFTVIVPDRPGPPPA